MENSGNIWRTGPLFPVEYYVPEFLATTIGLTTKTRDGFFGTLAFTLAEDGTLVCGPSYEARPASREQCLSFLLFRAYFFEEFARTPQNPVRRALCVALSERFLQAHQHFSEAWPETLPDACTILSGANLPYSPVAITWDPDVDNPFRFPIPKKPIAIIRCDGDSVPSTTKRMVRLSPTAEDLLHGGYDVSSSYSLHDGATRLVQSAPPRRRGITRRLRVAAQI